MTKPSFLHLLLLLQLIFPSSFGIDFLFNGFHDDSDLYILPGAALESNTLVLTKAAGSVPGRALYKHEIPTKSSYYPSHPLPFSTSFVFSALPNHSPVFFLSFILAPTPATTEHIPSVAFNYTDGALQKQNQILSVEFGVSRSDWEDAYDDYACVNVNSRSAGGTRNAGYTDPISGSFRGLALNNGEKYQAWIDYADSQLNVTVATAGLRKPNKPLLSVDMDPSQLVSNETYAGFFVDAEIGDRVGVFAWSFSNSNFSMHEVLTTSNLPSFSEAHKSSSRRGGFIAGISVAAAVLFGIGVAALALFIRRKAKRKIGQDTEEMEEWELEYWPHQIRFEEIFEATDGFSDSNVIGKGSNGKVYKGVLRGQMEVAVKCIGQERRDGMREFLAEISTLGRLRHRNLVGLRGWCKCKRGRGNLMLVYDFMKNGSLDRRIFDCDGHDGLMLGWGTRVRVLRDVAAGVLYLHEGWEEKVVHGDIKASNVVLDGTMRGRLGDFGLARVHPHAARATPLTTRVVGTVGYMAPEVVRGGKVSEKADVFGFGVLVLEVVCGRRPVEDGSKPLVEWVRGLMEGGEWAGAVDGRLEESGGGGYEKEEAERLLQLGLRCTSEDPHTRPSMREVVSVLDGEDGGASKGHWLGNPKHELHESFTQPHEPAQSSFGRSCISDPVVEAR
ncbi:hypothetical protein ACLOJK_010762 [Asimina triloba]